jgi:hypothetical protein
MEVAQKDTVVDTIKFPQNVHVLTPRVYENVILHGKRDMCQGKDLDMGKSS